MSTEDKDKNDQDRYARGKVIRFEDGGLEPYDKDESGESGESGGGSQSGEIEFRFIDERLGPTRDDKLPPTEIKRLHMELKETHKGHVENQKHLLAERAALKEGKYVASAKGEYQQGLSEGRGSSSEYSNHPLLSKKAQFDGVDKQMSGVPSLNEAKTNPDLKNELKNRLTLTNAPRFHPTPTPNSPRRPG